MYLRTTIPRLKRWAAEAYRAEPVRLTTGLPLFPRSYADPDVLEFLDAAPRSLGDAALAASKLAINEHATRVYWLDVAVKGSRGACPPEGPRFRRRPSPDAAHWRGWYTVGWPFLDPRRRGVWGGEPLVEVRAEIVSWRQLAQLAAEHPALDHEIGEGWRTELALWFAAYGGASLFPLKRAWAVEAVRACGGVLRSEALDLLERTDYD